MRVFGYSIPLFLLFLAFFIGAKNPGILARIPILNRV